MKKIKKKRNSKQPKYWSAKNYSDVKLSCDTRERDDFELKLWWELREKRDPIDRYIKERNKV